MSTEYVGANGIRVEITPPVDDRVYSVLRGLTGESSPRIEGLSREACIKWAIALVQKRDELWRTNGNATWKKYRHDFREGDEAFELGQFYQFLLNCNGIKAVTY